MHDGSRTAAAKIVRMKNLIFISGMFLGLQIMSDAKVRFYPLAMLRPPVFVLFRNKVRCRQGPSRAAPSFSAFNGDHCMEFRKKSSTLQGNGRHIMAGCFQPVWEMNLP